MPRAASQNHGDPWNLAGWVTPRQPRSRWEGMYLASGLTNCASGGSPSNTPSRKIWEVEGGLNHRYFCNFFSCLLMPLNIQVVEVRGSDPGFNVVDSPSNIPSRQTWEVRGAYLCIGIGFLFFYSYCDALKQETQWQLPFRRAGPIHAVHALQR